MGMVQSLIGVFPKRGFVLPEDSVPQVPALKATNVVTLRLDALISEAPEFDATPTQSQVESGETISDHVTLKPIRLNIQGIVTDTPVSFDREFAASVANTAPSKAAHVFLKKLYEDRIPFDFVGGFEIYESMVMTKYAPLSTAETGDSLRFHCTLEQIKTVFSQVLTSKKGAAKTSRGTQNLGTMSATEKEAIVDAKGNDLTASASGGLTNEINAATGTAQGGAAQSSGSFFGDVLESMRIK